MSSALVHHFYVVDVAVISDLGFFWVVDVLVIMFFDEFLGWPGVVVVENDVVGEVALGVAHPVHPIGKFFGFYSVVSGVDP